MPSPKSVNKSKISTAFNKDFTSTKLKKIPKKFSVYIPSNLTNNRSPRTAYDSRGLYAYYMSEGSRRAGAPLSPMTRKPVNINRIWSNLYTNEEIQAAKNKKSHKYKLIEHMKTRKHLSSKNKIEYLNQLKNGKKINNLINDINKFTIPKQNIQVKTKNNVRHLESAVTIMNFVNTDASLFKPKFGQNEHIKTLNGNREWAIFFKKLRTFVLEKLANKVKSNGNINSISSLIPILEKTVLAAKYMENPDFSHIAKEMPKNVNFKINKNKLYDYIKKNIFRVDGMTKIQIYITQTYYKLLFGKYLTERKIYINSKDIVRQIKIKWGKNGFNGKALEDMIEEDFSQAETNLLETIVYFLKIYKINYNNTFINNYLKIEPMINKKERIINNVAKKYFSYNYNRIKKLLEKYIEN